MKSETPSSASQNLFIGVPVSMRSLRAVANAASEMKERSAQSKIDFRWVAPARYHVTLKYLGWTKNEVVPAIRDEVARAISRAACRHTAGVERTTAGTQS
jgi:2'-5' RNA ligase